MLVTVDLKSEFSDTPTKSDMQKNIDALRRYVDNKQHSFDFVLLIDTIYILEELKDKLPEWR